MGSFYAVTTEPWIDDAAIEALRNEFDHGDNDFTVSRFKSVSFVLRITSSNAEFNEMCGYFENVARELPDNVPPFTLVFMTDKEPPVVGRMSPTKFIAVATEEIVDDAAQNGGDPEILTMDVVSEARLICTERGIDPDESGLVVRKIRPGEQSPYHGDIGRSYDSNLPRYAAFMDLAAERIIERRKKAREEEAT